MPVYRCRWPGCKTYLPQPGNCRRHRQIIDAERNARSFYTSKTWRRLRRACIRRDGRCLVPGCNSRERLTAHHRVPREQGGPDSLENLRTLCASCHSRYEADVRAGRITRLRRAVEAL